LLPITNFFGTDVKDTGGTEFGPTNDASNDNVAKVMNTLNADVYAVQEVSDDAALDLLLLTKISINGKTLRNQFSSLVTLVSSSDANFPPQKLVVIYNTQTTAVKRHVYYSLNCTMKYVLEQKHFTQVATVQAFIRLVVYRI
jgi:hypothetical protein